MRTRKPINAINLKIRRSERVLEVGSGHNPTYRANVLVEKFLTDDTHRSDHVKVFAHQILYNADGEHLPFKDKEFDYVICKQVLEHVDNPIQFVNELTRVGKRGYLETPSLIGEFLFPKLSHKWTILDIDNKLVMFEKSMLPGNYKNDYGDLFLNYFPYQSLPYKILTYSEGDLMINRYEWSNNIDILVNPNDEYYKPFFFSSWDREKVIKLFPPRGIAKELRSVLTAIYHILTDKLMQKLPKKNKLLTLDEYIKIHGNPRT